MTEQCLCGHGYFVCLSAAVIFYEKVAYKFNSTHTKSKKVNSIIPVALLSGEPVLIEDLVPPPANPCPLDPNCLSICQ